MKYLKLIDGVAYECNDLIDMEDQIFAPIAPSEQREQAYNAQPCVEWDGAMLTVTGAAQKWAYYAAEGSTKAGELRALIAAAKEKIRERYPDVSNSLSEPKAN